ncbi:hypothetical protein GCM10009551_078090 [Nocardiopsis tropica]|uniref:hypothetical protein n=1 Tax=Tsukamurella strandjordii TaxID=147577 RepID=UPI0031DA1649
MPGATAKYALPYALGNEHPRVLNTVSKLLAERLEAILPTLGGGSSAPAAPMASILQNTAYSYDNQGLYTLFFNGTVEYDKNSPGGAQASADRLTVRKAGMYLVTAVCPWDTKNANGHRVIKLVTLDAQGNSTTVAEDVRPGTTTSLEQVSQISVLLPLPVGAQLTVQLYQTSGTALVAGGTQQGAIKTRLAMQWVSATA